MKEAWIIGVYAAVLASVPAHLRLQLKDHEGGPQPRQTLVLPVVAGDKQYAFISFYESEGPVYGKTPRLYPPFATVKVSYPSKEVHWEDVRPEMLGLKNLHHLNGERPYLGLLESGSSSMKEWRNASNRYDTLISIVLERRWLLTNHKITAEERTTAQELTDCTRILYEKPLLPYYHSVGRHFFAWMARAAK